MLIVYGGIGGWLLDVDLFDGFNVLLQLAFLLGLYMASIIGKKPAF